MLWFLLIFSILAAALIFISEIWIFQNTYVGIFPFEISHSLKKGAGGGPETYYQLEWP